VLHEFTYHSEESRLYLLKGANDDLNCVNNFEKPITEVEPENWICRFTIVHNQYFCGQNNFLGFNYEHFRDTSFYRE
jgi:hypothetical protein